jgi:acetyltransferase-like isoleucine patch superfamily enzyme
LSGNDDPMIHSYKKSTGLRRFAAENGWLLLMQKITGAVPRRLRDSLLARKLHTTGLRLGHRPVLAGLAHIQLGANFSAGNSLWLEAVTTFAGYDYHPLIVIGDNCGVSDQVHIACTNRVTIGPGLLSGSRVIITDHSHGTYSGDAAPHTGPSVLPVQRRLSNHATVTIGANVWLGDGVAVLADSNIGDGSIIGANSVVSGSIPPDCIAVGVPARPIRRWNAAMEQWIAWRGDAEDDKPVHASLPPS